MSSCRKGTKANSQLLSLLQPSSQLQNKKVLVQNPVVLPNRINEEMGLLHPRRGRYYALNAMGVVIWDAMQKPATIDQVVTRVMLEIDLHNSGNEANECIEGVRNLCEELLRQGFIHQK